MERQSGISGLSPDGHIYHLRAKMRSLRRTGESGGFTLTELIITVAILGVLVSAGVPMYAGYVEKARNYAVMDAIAKISLAAQGYGMNTDIYPQSLAQIGYGNAVDPWGNPYRYLNIRNAPPSAKGSMRKDRFLVPINSDFDLYSMGKDGNTTPPLTAKESKDDIIRANDGQYIGLAEGY